MARLVHRRIRAPQRDGAALIEPSLAEVEALISRNKPVVDQAREARRELLAVALRHTGQYRETSFLGAVNDGSRFLLSGHQPELFHPGVWFKSFLLSSLAKRWGAVPINLIIDTDAVHGIGIRVPGNFDGQVHAPVVAFDAPGTAGAWEERPIVNGELWASFARRVSSSYANIVTRRSVNSLIVNRLWELVPRPSGHVRLGMALARARHLLEGECGLQTLEAPMSSVAQMPSFRRFALDLLIGASHLREAYNASLAEYRRVYRVRSRTHPVPALAAQQAWLEAPFFLWTSDDLRRRGVFVKGSPAYLELTDRENLTLRLSLSTDQAIEQLAAYEAQGIKLRPRALVTTMFARMFLSDAFIHGIGGAKYDELTDSIIQRYFGVQPLEFITATATFRLPIDRPDVTEQDVRACAEQLRSIQFRPETLANHPLVAHDIDLTSRLSALADEKREFLARNDLRRCQSNVFRQLESLNVRMQELLKPVERELLARHAELTRQLAQTKLLGSREYSFVLFNSEILPARLLDLCKVS